MFLKGSEIAMKHVKMAGQMSGTANTIALKSTQYNKYLSVPDTKNAKKCQFLSNKK